MFLQSRASLHSHIGNQNNVISWKLLTFSVLLIDQEMFLFDDLIDIRGEPARPCPTRPDSTRPDPVLTLFDGLFLSQLNRYKPTFQHYLRTGFKIVVSNFEPLLTHFLGISQKLLNISLYFLF